MLLARKPSKSLSALAMNLTAYRVSHVANTILSQHRATVPTFSGFYHCCGYDGCHLMSSLRIQKGLDVCSNICKSNSIHHSASNPFIAANRGTCNLKPGIAIHQSYPERKHFQIWNRSFSSKQTNCDSYSSLLSSRLEQSATTRKTNMMVTQKLSKFMSTIQEQASKSLGGGSSGNPGSGMPIEDDQDSLITDTKSNKSIKINACGELYTEVSKTKPTLFSGSPKDCGIDFDVQYYDSLDLLEPNSHDSATGSRPVVCLLHGAPGHYKDFTLLIKYLTKKGVRVVAPNFPNYNATFEHSFRHSPRERLDFLLQFFKAIQLDRVDLLVGHSSAVYTMFELLEHSFASPNRIKINSLGLFSTPTYNLPPNLAVTPARLFTLKLFDYPILRPIIVALIQVYVKIQGIKNRVDKDRIDNLLIAASAVGYSDCEKMSERLKLVKEHNIPTFVVIGTNDKLIPMRCFNQLKRDLGVTNENDVKHYDSVGKLLNDANQVQNPVEVLQFESGGHYAFQRFSNQVNDNLYGFLKRHSTLMSETTVTKL